MQQRVLVVGQDRKPLMPCSPARARILLKAGRAAILRYDPLTIILTDRKEGEVQPLRATCDPGAQTTGMALVARFSRRGWTVVWAMELQHRGGRIRQALMKRRTIRRARRSRKTRYRQPRFLNRQPATCEGCGRNAKRGSRFCRHCKTMSRHSYRQRRLAPSLESRVSNVVTWVTRLCRHAPVASLTVEHVKFDTHLLQNPNLSGVEYQRGTLFGYELREYLLEQWAHRCAYCAGASGDPILNIDHVIPRSRGGSNRVSNLVVACRTCNDAKGNQRLEEWGTELVASRRPLDRIRAQHLPEVARQLVQPLRHAAAVNTIRWVLVERVRPLGLSLELGSGGMTKRNRSAQGYPKRHWIDAACTGESGSSVRLDPGMRVLRVEARGYGTRRRCGTDQYGFPIRHAPAAKSYMGFRTGDLVRARIPRGKHAGTHVGHIAIRHRPSFRLNGMDVHPKYLTLLQRSDGYAYSME